MLPGAGVTRLLQSSACRRPVFPRETALEEAALEADEDELAGESDRVDVSSSWSRASERDDILERVDRLRGGDLTMFARARFATDTCRTMVAGVTVIVDKLESRFSLSREKLTCSSPSPDAVSTEVAGDAVAPGVFGGNRGLSEGLGEGDPDSGVRTIPITSCQR